MPALPPLVTKRSTLQASAPRCTFPPIIALIIGMTSRALTALFHPPVNNSTVTLRFPDTTLEIPMPPRRTSISPGTPNVNMFHDKICVTPFLPPLRRQIRLSFSETREAVGRPPFPWPIPCLAQHRGTPQPFFKTRQLLERFTSSTRRDSYSYCSQDKTHLALLLSKTTRG